MVYPGFSARVMVAVYVVMPANTPVTSGDHVTVPVYCSFSVMLVTGIAPVFGDVMLSIKFILTVL